MAIDQGFGDIGLAGDLQRFCPVISMTGKDTSRRVEDLGPSLGPRHAFSGHEHSLTFINWHVN